MYNYDNDFQKSQSAKILAVYGVDANALEKAAADAELKKSEEAAAVGEAGEGEKKEDEKPDETGATAATEETK